MDWKRESRTIRDLSRGLCWGGEQHYNPGPLERNPSSHPSLCSEPHTRLATQMLAQDGALG